MPKPQILFIANENFKFSLRAFVNKFASAWRIRVKNYKCFITRILLLIVTINVMLFCVSCGNDDSKNESISEEKAMDIVNKLMESSSFETNLIQVNENVIISSYRIQSSESEDNKEGNKKEDIKVIAGYMGDGTSAEEIVVLKGDKNTIKELTDVYLKNKAESYRDYLPVESDKVDNAVVVQYGDISIICISKDWKLAESIIKQ